MANWWHGTPVSLCLVSPHLRCFGWPWGWGCSRGNGQQNQNDWTQECTWAQQPQLDSSEHIEEDVGRRENKRRVTSQEAGTAVISDWFLVVGKSITNWRRKDKRGCWRRRAVLSCVQCLCKPRLPIKDISLSGHTIVMTSFVCFVLFDGETRNLYLQQRYFR